MFQMRLTIFLMLALSILPGTLGAQGPTGGDSGEYVILNGSTRLATAADAKSK